MSKIPPRRKNVGRLVYLNAQQQQISSSYFPEFWGIESHRDVDSRLFEPKNRCFVVPLVLSAPPERQHAANGNADASCRRYAARFVINAKLAPKIKQ